MAHRESHDQRGGSLTVVYIGQSDSSTLQSRRVATVVSFRKLTATFDSIDLPPPSTTMESSLASSKKTSLDSAHTLPVVELPIDPEVLNEKGLESDTPVYPSVARQWSTLLVLNLAMMIDVVSSSALFVVVTQTASDLSLSGPDTTWM